MATVLTFVIAGVAGLIIVAVVVYYYAGIMVLPGQQESQLQQTLIQEEIRSGNDSYQRVNITVNGQSLIADVSATAEQRTRGLTVKDALAENEAMLFVFNNQANHKFWMKDMKFPIDIIWIGSDKSVIDIENSLKPCNSGFLCSTYEPDGDSLYVLETVSGFAQRYGIVKGTIVEFELNAQNLPK
jgi:uncharacterized protein